MKRRGGLGLPALPRMRSGALSERADAENFMNDDQLDKLCAAARQAKPDTSRVELGFETRLLARLRAERASAEPWFVWAWRLTPVFAAVVVALGAWEFAATPFATLDSALAAQGVVEFWMGD